MAKDTQTDSSAEADKKLRKLKKLVVTAYREVLAFEGDPSDEQDQITLDKAIDAVREIPTLDDLRTYLNMSEEVTKESVVEAASNQFSQSIPLGRFLRNVMARGDSSDAPPESELGPIRQTGPKLKPETNHSLPSDANQILEDILELRGWARREGQVQMVETLHDAGNIKTNGDVNVAINAPVGTGKTLAYLLPTIASGKRIAIATSTKGLQDQVMKEELPRLASDLKELYNYDLTYGVLKGKSNYACSRTLKVMLENDFGDDDESLFGDIDMVPDVNDLDMLKLIQDRMIEARKTNDSLMYDSEQLLWNLRSDTRSHILASKRCAGKSEPWVDIESLVDGEVEDFDGPPVISLEPGQLAEIPAKVARESACIYRAAYAHSMDSQIVVLNTTLLIFEVLRALSPAGGQVKPSILRGVETVIVDEAHHLFANISEAYSVELDFGSLKREAGDIAKRLNKRYQDETTKMPSFDEIITIVEDTEESLDEIIDNDDLTETAYRTQLGTRLFKMFGEVERFMNRVQVESARIERSREDSDKSKLNANGVPKTVASLIYSLTESMDLVNSIAVKITQGRTKEGKKKVEHFNSLSFSGPKEDNLTIKTVPIDVSFFREDLSVATGNFNPYTPPREDMKSLVALSSGTITHNTPVVVGMNDPIYLDVETPFDPSHVRVYIPPTYAPSDARWRDDAWHEQMKPAIRQTGGRTMVLTTSLGKMHEFAELCTNDLEPEGFTVFKQGQMGKLELIEALKSTEKAVLFGTRSFWEGVDIQGPALSLVIVDKIPFPQPDDALFTARREFITRKHGNPDSREASTEAFMKVDVDYASVMIAQGTGRLIRSVTDVGGIMVLDHRFLVAGYASKLTRLLPPKWQVTRDQEAFHEWLAWVNPDTRNGDMPKVAKGDDRWFPMRKPISDTRRNIGRRRD